MFICQVLCTGIQGIYALLIGGSINQSRFVCQVWCSSIQGIYSSFTGGSICQSRFICQVFVYWYSRHLFSINWGVHLPKYVSLPSFCVLVFKASAYALLIGGPLAKVGSSAKFGVAVFKASILDWLGVSIIQSRFVCQVLCTGIQGIYALLIGWSISQSRFICQVWCSSIQGIYSWLTGGSIIQSMFVCQVWCSSIQGIYSSFTGGSIMPKYVHLPQFLV